MVTAKTAEEFISQFDMYNRPNGELGIVTRYIKGKHDLPYVPKGARREYRDLQKRSITNMIPTLRDTLALPLIVSGYRPSDSLSDSPAWASWQANGMDARSIAAHRAAVAYGVSYVLVLPSRAPGRAYIRPIDPANCIAWYTDDLAEFPEFALHYIGRVGAARIFDVYTSTHRYTFKEATERGALEPLVLQGSPRAHGMGVVPIVRLSAGESLLDTAKAPQDRLSEAVFNTSIAMQFASFRQRWATGLAIPEDENGNPMEPFAAAVDRLWVTDSETAKFGDFAQTDIGGHLEVVNATVDLLAAVTGVNPQLLRGLTVDGAKAGAARIANSMHANKVRSLQASFGESWASVMRLAARASGDAEGAADVQAQIRWADLDAESVQETVQALTLAVQSLGVPAEGVWDKIPGATDDDVTLWRNLAKQQDPILALARETARQSLPAAAEAA